MRRIVVFGGTGFLGRRVVRHLLEHDFRVRVASRNPDRGQFLFGEQVLFGEQASELEFVRADVGEDASVRAVVADAFGIVNAVSLYVERGGHSFRSVHVDAAARVARHSRDSGVVRLVHVSGIGADHSSTSRYIRSRGEGEGAVRSAFPSASVIRPSVMFGPDDAFLTALTALLRKTPLVPMFGRGRTRLQPAYVEDVGEAIARLFASHEAQSVYELGGPRIYTYEGLLRALSIRLGLRRALVPVPFAVWQTLAICAEFLPRAPITRNQVELMRIDNVASPAVAGFAALGIEPAGIQAVIGN